MDARKNNITSEGDFTIGQFFEALSASEYPDYILELIEKVQDWMREIFVVENDPEDKKTDPVAALFETDPEPDMEELFSRIEWLEKYADVLPNVKRPIGREEVAVINVGTAELESCMRIAVDYASIFNSEKCRRVWIISDSFNFMDISGYVAHISKLSERGITFRFLLVTPWGWVEMPIEGNDGGKNQILWKTVKKRAEK
ncbi:MAG: hypothetical protein FWE49_04210 [Synergistaceae bacterium]|nr:hypothetical protein [Synergistaceae bacterium]